MIKKLLAEWLEERRLGRRPPLPQDATIYIMAFVEWAEKKSAEQPLAVDVCRATGGEHVWVTAADYGEVCGSCGTRH